jgi:hypothetical protein
MPDFKPDFKFEWELHDPAGAEDGEAATWGYLRITLGSQQLWGPAEGSTAPGVRWTWIELLEHLSRSWLSLIRDRGWPSALPVGMRPNDFDIECRRALEKARGQRKLIEAVLFEFRQRHDLSVAVSGKAIPQLWIVRLGDTAWVDSHLLPWAVVEAFLTSLGETIATRLRYHPDSRSRRAIQQWTAREDAFSDFAYRVHDALSDLSMDCLGECLRMTEPEHADVLELRKDDRLITVLWTIADGIHIIEASDDGDDGDDGVLDDEPGYIVDSVEDALQILMFLLGAAVATDLHGIDNPAREVASRKAA